MGAEEEKTTSESLQSRVEEQIASVDRFVDRGLSVASDALRSSTAVAKDEVEKVVGLAKVRNNLFRKVLFVVFLLDTYIAILTCFASTLDAALVPRHSPRSQTGGRVTDSVPSR